MCIFKRLITVVSEETEKIEEEVDKVEIETQGTDCGEMADAVGGGVLCDLLDLLGVPCCQSDEYEHTGYRYDPVECGAMGEDIDQGRYDQSDQRVEQEVAPLREVLCGEIAVDAHRSECTGTDEECLGYGGHCVDEEYRRESQTVDGGEEIEEQSGRGGRHLVDASGDG